MDQSPRAEPPSFWGYPEQYDELETVLVPQETRARKTKRGDRAYVDYYIHFRVSDVDDWLAPLPPLVPRPPDLLPRSRHRQSAEG